MELSYDELRRIHRLEKSTSKLVEVDEGFYSDLQEFVSKEKSAYLESLKDFSSAKAREFTNLKKMAEEIFALRTKKVLGLALVASRMDEEANDGMASHEKKLFRDALSALERHGKVILSVFSDKHGAEAGKDLNTVAVEILSEVPEFVGTDMKVYGPFKRGAKTDLPLKVAKLLCSQKLAEELG